MPLSSRRSADPAAAVLEQIKAQQAAYPAHQQRGNVARRRPPNNLEAPGLPSEAAGFTTKITT
jgi:hypothetical protein